MRKQLVFAGATLLATSLAVSGCGTRAEEGTGGAASSGTKTAKIGVIAPLSGDLSALGLGIQNSVELAVKQANEKGTIPGWTLEVDAQDDQALPDTGKNAATKLAGDDEVVGVVGTLNSSVAQSVQPVPLGGAVGSIWSMGAPPGSMRAAVSLTQRRLPAEAVRPGPRRRRARARCRS